jgi:hypothetical protein
MMMADEGRELMVVAEDQSELPFAFNGTRISNGYRRLRAKNPESLLGT